MGVMTPSSVPPTECHDTVSRVTTRSGKGTARQTIRMDEDLWGRLGETAGRADADRSSVLRDFARWYVGEPGAEIPKRPDGSPQTP